MYWFMGLDESDRSYAVLVSDASGQEVYRREVLQSADSLAEFGGWINARVGEGIEVLASLERPHGRIVEFLLDHGVPVYPINPKSLDRARDRYRPNGANDDWFDAFVLSNNLRVDYMHLRPLRPDSDEATELRLLTKDRLRQSQHRVRCLNRLTQTLKEYYRLPLEVFPDLTTEIAQDFLRRFPTPESLKGLRWRTWLTFARKHRKNEAKAREMYERLKVKQPPVRPHIVRAKQRQMLHLVEELSVVDKALKDYDQEIERFFSLTQLADLARSLPTCKTGTVLPTLWAQIGDAEHRWESFRHLQAQAGSTPFTNRSGKSQSVHFRYGCNKVLRYAVHWFSIHSLEKSEWARAYYDKKRAQGKNYNQAIRALGAKWLKIMYAMWRDRVPYSEERHLANIARQDMKHALQA
jgi:hypothetical protein